MITPVKILVAGLVATAAMTMLMLVALLMGMPPMNIGAMLGGMMGASATVGWMMHFMIGVLFTAAYAFFFNKRLPSAGDGMLLGLMGSLMGHLLFGAVLGGFFSIQRPPVTRTLA